MSTGPQTDLKVLATGLGAGILIDAVVVRCLLVPALVALFGRANWWLPAPLARVLRIPVPPAPPAQPALPVRQHVERITAGDELVVTGAR
jgi:RND superfamily putative drug exporter